MKKSLTSIIAVAAALAATAPLASHADSTEADEDAVEAHSKAVHQLNPDFGKLHASKPSRGSGISYHGGPLILHGLNGGVNVYLIWYGNWSGNTATTIITDFVSAEGGSPYYNINTTYYDGSLTHLKNLITYSGSTTDNYSQGTSLSDAA